MKGEREKQREKRNEHEVWLVKENIAPLFKTKVIKGIKVSKQTFPHYEEIDALGFVLKFMGGGVKRTVQQCCPHTETCPLFPQMWVKTVTATGPAHANKLRNKDV